MSRASACFARSWTTSTPAVRIASRKPSRSGRGAVTTYNRAPSNRSPRASLATGDRADELEPVPVGERHLAVPGALEGLPVPLHDHEARVEAAIEHETLDRRSGRDLVGLAVRA